MLVGKGITYDTGGADLKTGGHMAGMSRDKGGAAGVAGFVKAVAGIRPQGVKVVAELAVVRNNIGALAFVSDEIIVGRSGVRVRIGNTDAEGRLVMADCLAKLVSEAASENQAKRVYGCDINRPCSVSKRPVHGVSAKQSSASRRFCRTPY